MKTLLILLLLPLFAWSVSEKEFNQLNNEKPHFLSAACEENSFLRGCFNLKKEDCGKQVVKSYDGCWKFLEKNLKSDKFSIVESQKKIDSCVFRDVALQLKIKPNLTAVCELPKKEIL